MQVLINCYIDKQILDVWYQEFETAETVSFNITACSDVNTETVNFRESASVWEAEVGCLLCAWNKL